MPSGRCVMAQNVFCSRTMTPHIRVQPMPKTIFRVKKNKKSWKRWFGPCRALISTWWSLSGITGGHRLWGSLHPQKIYGKLSKMFGTNLQYLFCQKSCASILYVEELMLSWRQREITYHTNIGALNLDFSSMHLLYILLANRNKLFTVLDLFLNIFLTRFCTIQYVWNLSKPLKFHMPPLVKHSYTSILIVFQKTNVYSTFLFWKVKNWSNKNTVLFT